MADQQPVKGKTEKSEPGSHYGRGNGVASCVESARENILKRPGNHADGEDPESCGGGLEIRTVQTSMGEDEVHEGSALGDGQG